MPAVGAGVARSVPDGPKYQVRAVVPGIGSVEKSVAKPGYGSPGVDVPAGDAPAPLSNSTRTCGSCLYAVSAASYVGISWMGSTGMVTTSVCGTPRAAW